MKHFIIRLMHFTLILLLILFFFISGIFISNRLLMLKCHIPGDADTLIVGDSHIMWSIDDSEIPRVKNISLNAEGYIYSYKKLNYILSRYPKVKYVYIGAGYHNFSDYYDNYIYGKQFQFFIQRYLGILNIDDYLQIIKRNKLADLPDFLIQIIRGGSKNIVKQECNLVSGFPEEKMTQTFNEEKMLARISEQYFYKDGLRNVSALNVMYFKKLIDLCEEKNIKIIFLRTPVSSAYVSRVPLKFKEFYNDLINLYNISCFDFPNNNLGPGKFLPDGDHVNYYGSKIVTAEFKEYHERIKKNNSSY